LQRGIRVALGLTDQPPHKPLAFAVTVARDQVLARPPRERRDGGPVSGNVVAPARETKGAVDANGPGQGALPGALCYGASREAAVARVHALALRVLADRLEHAEAPAELLDVSLRAA
jgi:hypothetical protein